MSRDGIYVVIPLLKRFLTELHLAETVPISLSASPAGNPAPEGGEYPTGISRFLDAEVFCNGGDP